MKKINKKIFLPILIAAFAILTGFIGLSLAQDDQKDVIGVRIIPNPDHLSIVRWYERQGFYGSPQAVVVDGYQGIRDGRTVYVNAANISGNNVYTNIYMISYNQDSSEKTTDILGQIVSRWKFNTDLDYGDEEDPATCSISSLHCESDADCAANQYCSINGEQVNKCQLKEEKNCRIDSDCPSGFYCNSDKAKIIRDVRRLSVLGDLKEALINYNKSNGHYPILSAGTYLKNYAVSVWPSWKQTFLPEIAVSPSFVDPINTIGYCPGSNLETCWDEKTNSFISNPQGLNLPLPYGSQAIVYSNNEDGSLYNMCSTMETTSSYNFLPANYGDIDCPMFGSGSAGGSTDNPTILVDYNLTGEANKEFNGFIKIFDADGGDLIWSVSRGAGNWSSWPSSYPKIEDTSSKFQKKIYAPYASIPGNFVLNLNIKNKISGDTVLSEELPVTIQGSGIFIEAQNATHVLQKGVPFVYNFYIEGDSFEPQGAVTWKIISGTPITPLAGSTNNPKITFVKVAENRYQFTATATINPDTYKFPQDREYEFQITARNYQRTAFTKNFRVKFVSQAPALQFSCPSKARLGQNYSCLLGPLNYLGQGIKYSVAGAFQYLSIVNEDGQAFFRGHTNESDYTPGTVKSVAITATSDYGAVANKQFTITLNSYCGDGKLQLPNTEGRGGPNNDGNEQCDGSEGITTNPKLSNLDKQYKCSTTSSNTPLEIFNNNYCVFAKVLDGGGYCGDGYCSSKYENTTNCPTDCSDGSGVVPTGYCDSDSICVSSIGDWMECNELTNRCELAPGRCVTGHPDGDNKDCQDGLVCDGIINKCVPECYPVWETTEAITYRQGDITRSPSITGCNVIKQGDPNCSSPAGSGQCPFACNDNPAITPIGTTGNKDSCWSYKIVGVESGWEPRDIYSCWNKVEVTRCLGDRCRAELGNTELNGILETKINKDGEMVGVCVVPGGTNTSANISCSALITSLACTKSISPKCMWDYNLNYCKDYDPDEIDFGTLPDLSGSIPPESCTGLNVTECKMVSKFCALVSTTCTTKNFCSSYNNLPDCEGLGENYCYWSDNSCKQYCDTITSPTYCTASVGCQLVNNSCISITTPAEIDCNGLTPAICNTTGGCTYDLETRKCMRDLSNPL